MRYINLRFTYLLTYFRYTLFHVVVIVFCRSVAIVRTVDISSLSRRRRISVAMRRPHRSQFRVVAVSYMAVRLRLVVLSESFRSNYSAAINR